MSSKEVAEQLLLQEYKTIINDKFATTVWETGSIHTGYSVESFSPDCAATYVGPYAIVLYSKPREGIKVQVYRLSQKFLSKMLSQNKYQQIHPTSDVNEPFKVIIHLKNYNLVKEICLPDCATKTFNASRLTQFLDEWIQI